MNETNDISSMMSRMKVKNSEKNHKKNDKKNVKKNVKKNENDNVDSISKKFFSMGIKGKNNATLKSAHPFQIKSAKKRSTANTKTEKAKKRAKSKRQTEVDKLRHWMKNVPKNTGRTRRQTRGQKSKMNVNNS